VLTHIPRATLPAEPPLCCCERCYRSDMQRVIRAVYENGVLKPLDRVRMRERRFVLLRSIRKRNGARLRGAPRSYPSRPDGMRRRISRQITARRASESQAREARRSA